MAFSIKKKNSSKSKTRKHYNKSKSKFRYRKKITNKNMKGGEDIPRMTVKNAKAFFEKPHTKLLLMLPFLKEY
jgi:hypothetical protein